MSQPLRIVSYSSSHDHNTNSSPWVDTLSELWQDNTGFDVLPYHRRYIAQALEDGIEETVIFMAMEETFSAPRPSFTYFQSIIANLRREHCFTHDQYMQRRLAWSRRPRK